MLNIPDIKEARHALEYHPSTEAEKRIICDWKYDGEYSVYNLPPYDEQVKGHRGFANPMNRFYSFLDGTALIGYINLVEEASEVFLGAGINPAFCNRGYGQRMCKAARALSQRLYPGKPVYLEVRTWNTRAVRCYEKAGFHIDGAPIVQTTSIGEGTFYRMIARQD